MEEDRKWEELIRLKIYDFEADTNPEDWDKIVAGLEGGKIVRLPYYRRLTYIASAAAVIALLLIGGIYILSDRDISAPIAVVDNTLLSSVDSDGEGVENVTVPDEMPVENPVNNLLAAAEEPQKEPTVTKALPVDEIVTVQAPTAETKALPVDETVTAQAPTAVTKALPVDEIGKSQKTDTEKEALPSADKYRQTDKLYLATVTSDVKRRRWSFGMGGGGYALGSTTGGASVTTYSGVLGDDEYMQDGNRITLRNGVQNTTLFDPIEGLDDNLLLGKVKYQLPISAGLGINYHLTDRWALQSGVVYTLLRSKENYMDEAGNIGERKQNLHFIGIPLSVSYSIAEWKRIQIYTTAGGMGEWNFAGKRKKIIAVENLETIEIEKIRMKESLWSVHTRAGAVYPLWKFIHVYAEAGVSYYFDNKSAVETIRSDKPFNVSLQAGIRLGF